MNSAWTLKDAKLDCVGYQQIQVIDPNGPTLLWQCELPDTEENELALLAPLDDQRFVALHQFGRVFIGNINQRELSELCDLKCYPDVGAWLDGQNSLLWVAAKHRLHGARRKQLLSLDLNTGELCQALDFPEHSLDCETLQPLAGGRFAFYGRNDKSGYKFRQHWLSLVDTASGQWQQQMLASKPTPETISIRPQRFIDRGRALVLLPAADGIKAGDRGFEYPLSLLNLDRPEEGWTQPVRL